MSLSKEKERKRDRERQREKRNDLGVAGGMGGEILKGFDSIILG